MNLRKELLIALLLALLSASASDGLCRSAAALKEKNGYDHALLEQINRYRLENGLNRLRLDPALVELARKHSERMLSKRKMDHENFNARFEQSGSRLCVENVGWNYPLPAQQFEGWRRSSGHNRNMLKEGLNRAGIAETGSYVTFFACR